ncbi:hypothetical protein [Aquisphaera insulae]|uniref:hypothetical protein n=1 Tax=Aquisphaera insulae TaxID=2712864 RepID=UPI0013EBF4F9|nr:hypothetical protein [Aquisphaera insulae]
MESRLHISPRESIVRKQARLDRIPWAGRIDFASFGARIGIRVSDRAALDRLPELLPPSWSWSGDRRVDRLYSLVVGREPGRRGGPAHHLYVNGYRLARTRSADEVAARLRSGLELSVSRNARGVVFVHAGVVGWRGRAIVIPGTSRSGKTTLVAAMLRAGAEYLSDEFAVLDQDGLVHPFPRALAIRGGPGRQIRRCTPEDLGATSHAGPLPIGQLLVTRHRPGARWEPRVLSPGTAVLAMLRHTVLARSQPDFSLAVLRRAVGGAAALGGVRGEADAMAASVLAKDRGRRVPAPLPFEFPRSDLRMSESPE